MTMGDAPETDAEIDDDLRKAMEADEQERARNLPAPAGPPAPPDFASGGGEIVPSGNTPYEVMDRRDEEQIMAELDGIPSKVLEEMVYSFMAGGQKITGLSFVGVKTLALEAGHIGIVDLKVQETPDSFRVMALAKDYTRNVTFFGIADQAKLMPMRSGAPIPDKFALQKAVSKAQRNAIFNLLPRKLVAEFISKCLKAKGPRFAQRGE
jgi:hypothetical protein